MLQPIDENNRDPPKNRDEVHAFLLYTGKKSRWSFVLARARCEANLLRRQWKIYTACLVVILYGGSVVFRNLAFFLYVPGERLPRDVGFDLLPEVKGYVTNVPLFLLQITCVATCVLTFAPIAPKAPFAVNILRRWGAVEAIGTLLRFVTYISTSVPGAADHCLLSKNPDLQQNQPKTLRDILWSIKVDGVGLEGHSSKPGSYNCGDLVFSGHMLMACAYALVANRYTPSVVNMPRRMQTWLFRPALVVLVLTQAVLTLMARNHYSMDVVIGLYVTPLLWHWYITVLDCEEMQPEVPAAHALGGSAQEC